MPKIEKIINRKCPLCNNLSLAQIGNYIFCLSSCGCKYTNKPIKDNHDKIQKIQILKKLQTNSQPFIF